MDKIFVSIASYRDPEIFNTVSSIIQCAKYPDLLKIVVFEQNDISDISCKGIFPKKQVLVINIPYLYAKGPVYARAVIQKYYSNEEYYLQIDSHSRFVKNWDIKLKHMLELLPHPAVLTQYPLEYTKENQKLDTHLIRSGLYIQGFGPKDGFTRIQSDIIGYRNRRFYPYTSKAWSACFSFSKGSIVKDAPYDITLHHLFFGEELDITLKLYTNGYYIFSPHRSIVFTLFKRDYRRTYWEDIPQSQRHSKELESMQKIWKKILNNDYGKIRSIDDYMKYACIKSFEELTLRKNAKSFRRHTKRVIFR